MSITALSTTDTSTSTATSSTTTTSSTYGLDADDFMTLLLTQIENQDPTDPTDMDTFTSQLCSLNQLQQTTESNEHLEDILSGLSSQAVNYIGKMIPVTGDTTTISGGATQDLSFNLADDASEALVTIYDGDGNAVRSIELSDVSSGTSSLSWDGTDDDGNTLDDGEYTFEVSAEDSDGESVTVKTYSLAQVTGVVYEDGTPYLVADGEEVSLDDVTSVYEA
jgi:flagellar basal-body rod modification protein FlgD